MHPFDARWLAAAAITASITAPASLAADTVAHLALPTAAGLETFAVAAPDAPLSPASRVNADLADKAGIIPPPTPGYEIASVVIVRTHDPAIAPVPPAPPAPAAAAAPAVAPVPGLRGFWTITAPTIRDAAALALALRADPAVAEAYLDVRTPQPLRTPPSDPGYQFQWHLHNTLPPGFDLNVEPAWKIPVTGAGITVAIIEDGWNTTHPDLAPNFNAEASQNGAAVTDHGTRVAGLVAAVANNGLGGVGVAYDARISRLYRGSALANSTAFLFRTDLNFIKNNSWGPPDNATISPITSIELAALAETVDSGRSGLGTVHIWAAGNGGTLDDRVDYDPYASSRYVIAVGAIDEDDVRAYYNEKGSSMFVVAPSSGDFDGDRGIYTTNGPSFYTASFGGTSASAPMVAGVVALMLEARPQLTWRDVKHILARTARRCDPDNPGWHLNAGGHWVSEDYGFGAVNAAAAVSLAQTWPLVGPEVSISTGAIPVQIAIPDNDPAGLTSTITLAEDLRVESVEVRVTATHPFIGDLRIVLTAPSGTQSLFTVPRADPTDNYYGFVFTSARHWDERAAGEWTLRISDEAAGDTGVWESWSLTVFGTPPCRADWNADNAVNSTDISAFLTAWIVSLTETTLDADFNADQQVNSTDVSAFLTAWLAAVSGGC